MSAHVAPAPQKQPKPRVKNVRIAKNATQRRVSRKARARYSMLFTFCAALAIVLACAMLYVMLTARLTGASYAYARAARERAALQAQAARLDDELARLRSDERLAHVAAMLHMTDPQQFALVSLPPPAPERRPESPRLAFLSGLAGLLRAK